jgi:4-hydroxymandelate oxidase
VRSTKTIGHATRACHSLADVYNPPVMNRREILQVLAGVLGSAALPRNSSAHSRPMAGSRQLPAPEAQTPATSSAPVNLLEYEGAAQKRLSKMAYDYVAEGAGDEITLHRNRECLSAIRLKPSVLIDVSRLDTHIELFGQKLDFPILLAPAAFHKLMNPEGEIATARGAANAGATLVVSSVATTSIEDIGKSAQGPLWFQLYVQRDRGFTRELVQRAEAAGCRALCITVDSPVPGTRNRETRDEFHLPPGLVLENLKAMKSEATQRNNGSGADQQKIFSLLMDPKLTWEGIDSIRSYAKVPVLLKGILNPDDARRAVEHEVSGIIVSNHGGRQLDTVPATIEALPRVIESVEGRIPVLMDGGIRRGTDVIKALAMGARAVLIARPYLWGLAVNGASGVEQVVRILHNEFLTTMALCGTPNIPAITRNILWQDR